MSPNRNFLLFAGALTGTAYRFHGAISSSEFTHISGRVKAGSEPIRPGITCCVVVARPNTVKTNQASQIPTLQVGRIETLAV